MARRKLDLLPEECRRWLAAELKTSEFTDITSATKSLNSRLQDVGVDIRFSTGQVADFSAEMKGLHEAYEASVALLAEIDLANIDVEALCNEPTIQLWIAPLGAAHTLILSSLSFIQKGA